MFHVAIVASATFNIELELWQRFVICCRENDTTASRELRRMVKEFNFKHGDSSKM